MVKTTSLISSFQNQLVRIRKLKKIIQFFPRFAVLCDCKNLKTKKQKSSLDSLKKRKAIDAIFCGFRSNNTIKHFTKQERRYISYFDSHCIVELF